METISAASESNKSSDGDGEGKGKIRTYSERAATHEAAAKKVRYDTIQLYCTTHLHSFVNIRRNFNVM